MTSSFPKVQDQAKEEMELQQLYDELDSVRAQLVCICCVQLRPIILSMSAFS